MKKITTIDSLFNLANYLDQNGFLKEANHLDRMIKKIAADLIPFDKERIKERSPEDSEESGSGELIEMSDPWVKRLKREREENRKHKAPATKEMPENIRERDLAEVILDSAGADHSLLSELNLDDEGLSREEMIDRIVEYIALKRKELAEDSKEYRENYLLVLSDGETYDSDGYIVRVSDEELVEVEESSGKSIRDLPPGNIKNIWDIIPESDMFRDN